MFLSRHNWIAILFAFPYGPFNATTKISLLFLLCSLTFAKVFSIADKKIFLQFKIRRDVVSSLSSFTRWHNWRTCSSAVPFGQWLPSNPARNVSFLKALMGRAAILVCRFYCAFDRRFLYFSAWLQAFFSSSALIYSTGQKNPDS